MKKIVFILLMCFSVAAIADDNKMTANDKALLTGSVIAIGAIASAPVGLTVVIAGGFIFVDDVLSKYCKDCKPGRMRHFKK